ncbi:hypothetical protein [Neobacillus cucumis]|uniref:Tyr recombinase domain-containing protein n=1 Tax=Neobacillus cucumis TaxID=1740721 RepID=A0A2N5H8U2_9BACI|nr:hypothetical protein [Neobacillus cucumis]PLS01942.1 hypothetical protein CVD27_22775 [Neobacillus cucumis]
MGKTVTKEKRLQKSHERVDKLFNWAENEKFSNSRKKKNGLSKTSYTGYREKMHALVNKYSEKFGEYEIVKFEKEKMMQLIREEFTNSFTQKAYTHAADFFTKASTQSTVFKAPVVLLDKRKMEEYWQTNGIYRRAKDSTVLKATHDDCKAVIEELKQSHSPYKSQAILAIELGRRIGSRIEGALSLRGKDIVLNTDGTATVHLNEKGNLDRWVRITNPEDVLYLEKLKGRLKKQDQTVMNPLHYRSGIHATNLMNQDKAAERLAKVTQSAAIRAGLSNPARKDEAGFSIHSARKTFCQTQVDHYSEMSKRELHGELDRRIEEQEKRIERLEKENYSFTSFREKYQAALERVNWVNKAQGIRRTTKERDLNHKELCLLLASFDSGHFRVDILRFYSQYFPATKKPRD